MVASISDTVSSPPKVNVLTSRPATSKLKLPEPTAVGGWPAIKLLLVVKVHVGVNDPIPRPVWAASLIIIPLTGAGTLLTDRTLPEEYEGAAAPLVALTAFSR